MSPNVTLAIIAGALVACGVYLITERSLSRILMGVMVAGNGVNLLFLVASGAAGRPPLIGVTPPAPRAPEPAPAAGGAGPAGTVLTAPAGGPTPPVTRPRIEEIPRVPA